MGREGHAPYIGVDGEIQIKGETGLRGSIEFDAFDAFDAFDGNAHSNSGKILFLSLFLSICQ